MEKTNINENIKKTSKIINYLLQNKDKSYFGNSKISIIDREILKDGLSMVMFEIEFSTYSEVELDDFIKDIEHINKTINDTLRIVKIDREGNITKKDGDDTLYFVSSILIDNIKFSHTSQEITLTLDLMFN